MDENSILILGVGNMLLGDEGIGVHVAHRLQKMSLPQHVEVIDGGTIGYELLPHLRQREIIIIVDALNADAQPGSIFRFSCDDLEKETVRPPYAHQGGVHELLHFTKQLEPQPEIVLYGIVPASTGCMTATLSDRLEQRMPAILALLIDEVNGAMVRFQRSSVI